MPNIKEAVRRIFEEALDGFITAGHLEKAKIVAMAPATNGQRNEILLLEDNPSGRTVLARGNGRRYIGYTVDVVVSDDRTAAMLIDGTTWEILGVERYRVTKINA